MAIVTQSQFELAKRLVSTQSNRFADARQ